MFSPDPLSNEGYSLGFTSEAERTNYVRAGIGFGTAYDDNVLPSSGQAVSDVRYSIWPSISLQQSRPRLGWTLTYSPGYTIHQNLGSINGIDHNLALGFDYRISPHVTLSLGSSFQKTSDLLNLPAQNSPSAGSAAGPSLTDSVVPPATARVSSLNDAEITYQFGPNAMVGARGTFSGLWYPDRAKLNGLYDSTAESASGFYTHRLSGMHYIGVSYGFQKLLTHPGQSETQTQSAFLFYTLYLPPSLSVSLFAGPEHSDTLVENTGPLHQWSPAAGASVAWHGEHASLGASYSHRIGDGGGLAGAVLSNRVDASARWRFARAMTAGLEGNYSTSSLLDSQLLGLGGHSWSGSASLQRPLGDKLDLQMGFTHLHQSYSSVNAISNAPNRNNVWISLSYQFERSLGR